MSRLFLRDVISPDGSMLAPEDLPAKHARVMRIVDPSQPSVASTDAASSAPPDQSAGSSATIEKVEKFTEDYASSEEDTSQDTSHTDDGWNVVAAKPKSTCVGRLV